MRLIDADRFYNVLHDLGGCGAKSESYADGWDKAIDNAISQLEDAPTIEAEPVKHGWWITSEMTIDSGCTSCSCCHSEYYIGDLQALEGDNDFVMFCPNCGAKMRGKND